MPKLTKTQQVEQYIWAQIYNGRWPLGSKLPGEEQLLEELKVSNTTLRHALSSLVHEGILSRKHGSGTYVCMAPATMDMLVEARVLLEAAIVGLTINKVTDDDIKKLESVVKKMPEAKNGEEAVRLDLEFHRALLEITRNPFITEFGNLLDKYFGRVHQSGDAILEEYTTDKQRILGRSEANRHNSILAAIASRDKELAMKFILEHIAMTSNVNDVSPDSPEDQSSNESSDAVCSK